MALLNNSAKLSLPTYDGSVKYVHPSVIDFNALGLAPWRGYRYWMAFTPYQLNQRERPSIVASHDGQEWEVPPNITNPVAGPWEALNDTVPSGGGSCLTNDPELVYDATLDRLTLYYGYINDEPGVGRVGRGGLYYRTFDGTTVSGQPCYEGELALSIFGLTGGSVVVHKEGATDWRMWQSLTDGIGYRTSSDGIAWSGVTTCTVTRPAFTSGFKINHIGGRYNRQTGKMELTAAMYHDPLPDSSPGYPAAHEHIALFECSLAEPTLVRSRMTDWVLDPSASGWDSKSLYRTDVVASGGRGHRRFWYSGFGGTAFTPVLSGDDNGIGYAEGVVLSSDPVLSMYGVPGLLADYRVTAGGLLKDSVSGTMATISGSGVLPNVKPFTGGRGWQADFTSANLVTIPTTGFDYNALTIVIIAGLNWQTAGVKQLLAIPPTLGNANKVDFYQAGAGAALTCDIYAANGTVVSRATSTIQAANGTNLMCACLWDSARILAYQSEDGITAAFATDAMSAITSTMYIGSNSLGTSNVNAPMHRVLVFNRTLTAAEFSLLAPALSGTPAVASLGHPSADGRIF